MNNFLKGIDVSEHNGVIDWEKVKASGIGFAMIRAGFGQSLDKQFSRNVSECERVHMPRGIYWFSYALSAAGAAREAAVCLEAVRPYCIDFPVAYDLEYDSVDHAQKNGVQINRALASDMVRAFGRAVRKAGYTAMNYANPDYLNRYFDKDVQTEFPVWLAQWPGGTPCLDKPPRTCSIWQYSDKGSIPGISGPVDLDICYAVFKKGGESPKMTGEQIYNALNEYLSAQEIPEWAREEFAEAKALGITDGDEPARLVPRYQAAIMAKRALSRRR